MAVLVLCTRSVSAQSSAGTQLKKNFSPLTNSLNYINQLEPKSFEYDTGKFNRFKLPQGTQFGFNADEVEKVLPGAVSRDYKWYTQGKNQQKTIAVKDVDTESLIPILVGAIKEQQSQIDQLQQEIERLKIKNTGL